MANLTISTEKEKSYYNLIRVLSVVIPLAVAVLLGIRQKVNLGEWTRVLPHFNAVLNSLTAGLLVVGLFAILNRKIALHRLCMVSSFSLGTVFLVSYVLYHLTNESTKFGGEGFIRPVYFFVLVSHIVLSIVVVPFVLLALYFALSNQFERHTKIVRWTFPIWLYVSISGVIAYLMISPYYR
jgi:putative membrane protein